MKSWFIAGSDPQDYELGIDANAVRNGKYSGYLKAKVADPRGFGTMMQMFKANHYLNKRMRFSAWVKSEGIEAWAGLWMRVDGPQHSSLSNEARCNTRCRSRSKLNLPNISRGFRFKQLRLRLHLPVIPARREGGAYSCIIATKASGKALEFDNSALFCLDELANQITASSLSQHHHKPLAEIVSRFQVGMTCSDVLDLQPMNGPHSDERAPSQKETSRCKK